MNLKNKTTLKIRSILFFMITSPLVFPDIAFSQWAFVARRAIGRIEQVSQSQNSPGQPATEVVTVILDAPAERVFDVAVNTIQKNQNVSIATLDQSKLTIKITQDNQVATLAIKPLSQDSSQLIIIGAALPGQNPQTTRITDGVMRVCNELGKVCNLAN